MKSEQIFIGDIRKCTKYETNNTFSSGMYIGNQCIDCTSFGYIDTDDEIYKENAVLIKLKNGSYVDLERLNSVLDYIRIYRDMTSDGYYLGGIMMSTSAYGMDSLFVDEKSLTPYYTDKQQPSHISVHQLKKHAKHTRSSSNIF